MMKIICHQKRKTMLSEIGTLFVLISTLLSFFLIFFSTKEIREKSVYPSKKIRNFYLLQLIFTNLSFIVLLVGYIASDFSLVNVYEIHTQQNHYFIKYRVFGEITKEAYSYG